MMVDVSSRPGALGRQFIDIRRERCAAILRILDAGWKRAPDISEVHPPAGEVEITEHLRTGMRAALEARVDKWCKKMTVLPGTESRSSPNTPRPDGRTDIPLLFSDIREKHDEHDPHAIIECKRVAGDNAGLCRQYVVEGIDRFKTGQYASNHTVGFMAGYLLSGGATTATARINRYLTRKERESELLESSDIIKEHWVRSSRHPRPKPAQSINLHHAFLALRSKTS